MVMLIFTVTFSMDLSREEYIQDLVVTETMEEEELGRLPLKRSYLSVYMNQVDVSGKIAED